MPELPEVENVVRTLSSSIRANAEILDFIFYRPDLRWKFPKKEMTLLRGQAIQTIQRRAKYILINFKDDTLISHLGMTGKWTYYHELDQKKFNPEKHDHLLIVFKSREVLVYSDPRRFGFIDVVSQDQLEKYFAHIGIEPMEQISESMIQKFKNLDRPIKTALMDQSFVVGIGNIYACEALFQSHVNPKKSCKKISVAGFKNIFKNVQSILSSAIEMGGSSISDYVDVQGAKGSFQNQFQVYGREGKACTRCDTKIKRVVQAGRSTFYCPSCQK